MQRTREINIGGRRIMIKELLVRDVWALLQQDENQGEARDKDGWSQEGESLKGQIDTLLSKCTGLKINDLLDYYPGELTQLWDAIMEVNQSFFDLPRKMGLNQTMEKLKQALAFDFNERFFGLWPEDTEAGSGTMDTPSSLRP